MKLNKSKNKNKGKVHPSPSSSPSPSLSSTSNNNNNNDPILSLNHLLPTAILTLISVLSLQDRQVLAYMITHSLNSSSTFSFDPKTNNKKKPHKKFPTTSAHKSPSFDCCCFVCFSSYWNLWNSSPHSELIDQAIEAFEEHLSKTDKHNNNNNNNNNNKSKRREKISKVVAADVEERESSSSPEEMVAASEENIGDVEERENENNYGLVFSPGKMVSSDVEERETGESPVAGEVEERKSGVQQRQQQHKGLARKVLPDFIGFFQSRLWNRLWGTNV